MARYYNENVLATEHHSTGGFFDWYNRFAYFGPVEYEGFVRSYSNQESYGDAGYNNIYTIEIATGSVSSSHISFPGWDCTNVFYPLYTWHTNWFNITGVTQSKYSPQHVYMTGRIYVGPNYPGPDVYSDFVFGPDSEIGEFLAKSTDGGATFNILESWVDPSRSERWKNATDYIAPRVCDFEPSFRSEYTDIGEIIVISGGPVTENVTSHVRISHGSAGTFGTIVLDLPYTHTFRPCVVSPTILKDGTVYFTVWNLGSDVHALYKVSPGSSTATVVPGDIAWIVDGNDDGSILFGWKEIGVGTLGASVISTDGGATWSAPFTNYFLRMFFNLNNDNPDRIYALYLTSYSPIVISLCFVDNYDFTKVFTLGNTEVEGITETTLLRPQTLINKDIARNYFFYVANVPDPSSTFRTIKVEFDIPPNYSQDTFKIWDLDGSQPEGYTDSIHVKLTSNVEGYTQYNLANLVGVGPSTGYLDLSSIDPSHGSYDPVTHKFIYYWDLTVTPPPTSLRAVRSYFRNPDYCLENPSFGQSSAIDAAITYVGGGLPPVLNSFTINSGAALTTSRSVTLNIDVSNMAVNGQMRLANTCPGLSSATWETYATTKSWTLDAGAVGNRTVYAQFKNDYGTIPAVACAINDSIIYDVAPSGTFSINNDAEYTLSNIVTLNMSIDNVLQMRFSNDNSTWSSWEAYSATKLNWPMATAGDYGHKTVYAQFKNYTDTLAITKHDDILYTSLITSGTLVINDGDIYTPSPNVTLTLDINQTLEAQMRFSNDNSTWSSWEDYNPTKLNWTLANGTVDGLKTVYGDFKNVAGSLLPHPHDDITLVLTPSGSFSINNGAAQTTILNVTLNIDVQHATEMQFSNDPHVFPTTWIPYATTTPWTLVGPFGVAGYKTVYGKFRNVLLVEFPCQATILYTAIPAGTMVLNGGDECTNHLDNNTVYINVDNAATMSFSNDDSMWGESYTYATTYNPIILEDGPPGIRTLYGKFIGLGGQTVYINTTIKYDPDVIIHSFVINHNESATSSLNVELNIDVTYARQMRFNNYSSDPNDTHWSAWEPCAYDSNFRFVGNKSWTLKSGSYGARTVYAEFKGYCYKQPASAGIDYKISPIVKSFVINHDEPTTSSLNVELNIDVDNADSMQFSNDRSNWSNIYHYSTRFYPWLLIDGPSGPRTVYAIFTNASTASAEANDDIRYVAEPIIDRFVINNDDEYTISLDSILNIEVRNADEMRFNNVSSDPGDANWSSWEPYGTNVVRTKDWPLLPPSTLEGERVVYAEFKNAHGTVATSDTIKYVIPIPVTGTFVINNNEETTVKTPVVLNVNVTGAYKMRFKNEIYGKWNNTDADSWYPIDSSPFVGNVNWTLEPGFGVKRVYGEFASVTSTISDVFLSGSDRIPNLIIYDDISLIRITPPPVEAIAGDSVIDVTWQPSTVPGLIGYNLYRSLVPGTDYVKIAHIFEGGFTVLDVGHTIANTYKDKDVINGITYYYVVTALVEGGLESDLSNETNATPKKPETVLDKQAISFKGISDNVKVFWTNGYMHSKTGIYKIKGNITELPKITGNVFDIGGIEEQDTFTGSLEEDENED